MNSLRKGIILGALQCVLVFSLTGKLLYDRATCPRIWVKTMPWDPNLPIRGRYLSLILAPAAGAPYFERTNNQRVVFFVQNIKPKSIRSAFAATRPSFGQKSPSRAKVRRVPSAWG